MYFAYTTSVLHETEVSWTQLKFHVRKHIKSTDITFDAEWIVNNPLFLLDDFNYRKVLFQARYRVVKLCLVNEAYKWVCHL